MCNVIVLVQGDHGMWSWRCECRGEWGCERVFFVSSLSRECLERLVTVS